MTQEINKLTETIKEGFESLDKNETYIENFDEVHLALKKSMAPLASAIKGIKPPKTDTMESQLEVMNKLNAIELAYKLFHDGKNASIQEIKQGADNLVKGILPDLIEILKDKIQLEIPTPQVDVNVPDVIVPDIKVPEVNVPQSNVEVNIDIDRLLNALEPLQVLSRAKKKPLAVRLSDGEKFVKLSNILEKLATTVQESNKQVVAYSSGPSEVDISASSQTSISNPQGYASIGNGRTVVTTAGTRVQLSATSVKCKRVVIIGEEDNNGTIAVGGSTVVASLATRQGVPLVALQSETIYINNLNKIYLDATVNGEGVTYVYYN